MNHMMDHRQSTVRADKRLRKCSDTRLIGVSMCSYAMATHPLLLAHAEVLVS